MTTAEVYQRIALVTTKYTFTHPVELADCDHVRAELMASLPGYGVEVYHRIRDVVVSVYEPGKDGKRLYRREMLVSGV